MSASSLNRKVAEIEKAKKVERRNALIQRYKSENDIIKHIEVEERGVPAETSGSDSPEPIKAEVPEAKPKKPATKKASRSKNGWSGKRLLSDS
jgi:hypothetical protein